MRTLSEIKKDFFKDLNNDNYSNEYIIQKYLCNGSSPILNEDKLFQIKYKISCKFGIHPNEVILTGSGKLGFSLAPNKNYKNFNEDSDIDIAIISDRLFDDFWYDLLEFNINITNRNIKEQQNFYSFINYLFKGWIRPDKFPFRYKGKSNWFKFFNDLTHDIYEYGEHKISAGIYKNYKTFELYNQKNIGRIRNEVKAGITYE